MKKIVLFITILFGIGSNSYSSNGEVKNIEKINHILLKEFTNFYGGYQEIYLDEISKNNILFLMNGIDIKNGDSKKIEFSKLKNGEVIILKSDEFVELENISNLKKLKVVGKTYKNSKVNLNKDNKKLLMEFTSIGEYKVAFTDKRENTKIIIFKREEKFKPEYENISRNIESAYKDNDVEFLNKNLIILKTFFPDSEKIKEALFYALELNEKNENYENVRKISQSLVANFKLDDMKKEEIIESYLKALKELNEIEEYLGFLERLSDYDPRYKDKFLDASIEYDNFSPKAVALAKEKIELEPTSKVEEYLGDYYYNQKNYRMAINYYKNTNNIEKLTRVYLESGDKGSLEKLKSTANSSELKKIKEEEKRYIESEKVKKYIKTAEEYVEQGKYQQAEIYYQRILKTDLSPRVKNDIYYKLSDVYYKLENFESAKKYIDKINPQEIDKQYLADYYYLGGIVYYNLKDYDKSTSYFKGLSQKFPNTSMSNRGKIYLLKIEKIKK